VWLDRGPPDVAHETRAMGLLRLLTAALGTHATCRDEVLRSAFGGKPENIWSL